MIIVCISYWTAWYNQCCKEFSFLWGFPPFLFCPFSLKNAPRIQLPDPIYLHITEGNRGGWSGPENKDGYRAWWSYHEMCTWSKWKPCHPEVYWMCPRRFYSVYNINILWSCCSIIHPSLRLQSHSGMPLSPVFICKCSVPCVDETHSFLVPIQRVLEHCADPKTQQIVMDEVLQSVCMLAQDQYGNYVVQVLFNLLNWNFLFPILNSYI